MRINIKNKNTFINLFNRLYGNNRINTINGLTIDSRKIKEGDIYFPIRGENFDGHDFINISLKDGAIIAFSELKNKNRKVINTKSVKNEIYKLCIEWQKLSKSKVIGITGSNGKTTSKNLIYNIFQNQFNCSKTSGNYNSTIGLPLTFLSTSLNDDYCILEYGASKPNEIKKLCEIVKPYYSFITNISNAHIENYNSFNEIYDTKVAIYKNTHTDGIAFINNDYVFLSDKQINCNSIFFNFSKKLNNTIIKEIKIPNHLIYLKNLIQSAAIISKTLKIPDNIINYSIKCFNLPNGRGNIIKYKNYNIINDSYNSNPKSMQLAIDRFDSMHAKGKKIIIIGDMLELGKNEFIEHKKLSKLINKSNIDIVLTIGYLSKHTNKDINQSKYSKHFSNINNLRIELNNLACNDDLVYLKGSRSMQLERIYQL